MNDTKPAVKVGDIFYSSWGYDQTNIAFYQVVRITPSGKSAEIKRIASSTTEDSFMSGLSTAIPDAFLNEGPGKVKRIQYSTWSRVGEAYFRITSYESAHPWDGKPKRSSWYA